MPGRFVVGALAPSRHRSIQTPQQIYPLTHGTGHNSSTSRRADVLITLITLITLIRITGYRRHCDQPDHLARGYVEAGRRESALGAGTRRRKDAARQGPIRESRNTGA